MRTDRSPGDRDFLRCRWRTLSPIRVRCYDLGHIYVIAVWLMSSNFAERPIAMERRSDYHQDIVTPGSLRHPSHACEENEE